MGEHHGANEAKPRGQAGRHQGRDAREQVRPEENRAQRRRIDAEPQIEPIGREALHDEPAGERIEREQRREPQHDGLGAADAEKRAGLGRRYLRGA